VRNRFYSLVRDLHLYVGLFISPFVLVFAVSVPLLVHTWAIGRRSQPGPPRVVQNLQLPANLVELTGRARVDAVKAVLAQAGVHGEIGFVRHMPKEHKLVAPVSIPGRESLVTLDLASRSATITERTTGLADALILLHKSPGPHLVEIRSNWFPMLVWRWLADATVYAVLLVSSTGVYLWLVLRSERRAGLLLLGLGALTVCGGVYALVG
jgi:hypothetical protein